VIASTRAFTVGSPVFRFRRTKQAVPPRVHAQSTARAAAPSIDKLLPDSPSLQGYTVCEIDESLTEPLVRWLSKRSD
jgi:hypothetical protein